VASCNKEEEEEEEEEAAEAADEVFTGYATRCLQYTRGESGGRCVCVRERELEGRGCRCPRAAWPLQLLKEERPGSGKHWAQAACIPDGTLTGAQGSPRGY